MRFTPLHDRVLIRPVEEDGMSSGGIIIPDTVREKPMRGKVVAAGPGRRNEKGERVPVTIRPGDEILFGKWSGTEVTIDGETLLIMNESDIMGVLEQSKASRKAA